MNHSSASVFSTRPRVSVYGTGAAWISLADFLGSMVTSILRRASAPYTLRFDSPADLPTGINIYTLQPAIPSAGRTVTSPSPRHSMRQYGNINPFFHRRRVRLCLRSRLTLIRLALIRKPWSFGGGGSRPPYRYSYLHLLFHALQQGSSLIFDAAWNAPLPCLATSTASADRLCPIIIHARSLD